MIKESANAKTYYRMEIEGFGSFFRSLCVFSSFLQQD
jgi:hypothetical protein